MNEPPFVNKRNPAQKWVCYFRVSTNKQGHSGLGLDAQRDSVTRYITEKGGAIIAVFTEIESGKKASNRPALNEAIAMCRAKRATLCIAKLDRLARNVHFISGLLETGVNFLAVDQPTKDRFMLHLHAAFAEEEARRISIRTKEALAAAKRRGVDIGATGRTLAARHKAEALARAKAYVPIIAELRRAGITQVRQTRDELNRRGVPSPGGAHWHLLNTHKMLNRIAALSG
ncbi:MAG TPA: recombinase family protein [Chthoniobacterales bacterium]|nr:recombinase family protein [Chthoniobacterales bacterium]